MYPIPFQAFLITFVLLNGMHYSEVKIEMNVEKAPDHLNHFQSVQNTFYHLISLVVKLHHTSIES